MNPTSPDPQAIRLFQEIPRDLIAEVLSGCETRQLAPGEILITPGEENHILYLLTSGALEVFLGERDSTMRFHIEPGECIGEMSIIEDRPTSAYVIAGEPSTVIAMTEEVFWGQFIRLPGAFKSLLKVLTGRMRKSNQAIIASVEQRLRYEQLQKEMAIAGKLQLSILPNHRPLFPDHPQVQVEAFMLPAKDVGGDLYDAFPVSADHICIAIGDVSGKGMPAALFMVRAITSLRMLLVNQADLAGAVTRLNQTLCTNNEDMYFVTLFIAILNVETGEMQYVNGGHNPPLLARHGAAFEVLDMPKGMLLGAFETAAYGVNRLTLHPGDTLFLYTDGLTEAENPRQELFSMDHTLRVVNDSRELDCPGILQSVQAAVASFSAGAPPTDDLTALALRYNPSR